MTEEREAPASGTKPSIAELTERVEDQSVRNQSDEIIEPSSISPGRDSPQGGKKSGKQSKEGSSKPGKQSQQASDKPAKKPQSKKKIEGAALIGIDVAKDADFSEWYQQVLTKGDFLDYYDVSGVSHLKLVWNETTEYPSATSSSLPRISSGRRYRGSLTGKSRASMLKTARFLYLCLKKSFRKRRHTSKALLRMPRVFKC